jgi:hypothetical protein
MNQFNKAIAVTLITALASSSFPIQAFAGVGPADFPGKAKLELDLMSAQPKAEEFKQPWIAPSEDGKYQLKMIGTKFAMVFEPSGAPLGVFDLSMNHLNWKEILLGGIGFGDLSLMKLIKAIKKGRGSSKRGNDLDAHLTPEEIAAAEFEAAAVEPSDDAELDAAYQELIQAANEDPQDREAIKAGLSYMRDVRFNDEWAKRNGVSDSDNEPGVKFRLGTFTMADIQFPEKKKEKVKESPLKPFILLASILYPDTKWDDVNIKEFMKEFEFRYNPKKPGYDVYWNREARAEKKEPKLPGLVMNFVNPWQNLVFKANLRQFDQYGEALVNYFGIYGVLMDLVLSRVCHGLSERVDYHERQFLGLLEEAEQFRYDPGIRLDYVNQMINGLYLSKFTSKNDKDVINGPAKRKLERTAQEKARPAVLKKLSKKENLKLAEVANGKFAVASKTKSGSDEAQFAGIYGLSLKPTRLFKSVPLHVNAKTPVFKLAERYAVDFAGFAARTLLPSNPVFRLGNNVYISIRIPSALYEYWIRSRAIDETVMEGELAGLVDEAIAGRYSMPLTQDQLIYTQKHLRTVQLNPYELSIQEEPEVILKNLKLLKQILSGARPSTEFRPENMVPIVL